MAKAKRGGAVADRPALSPALSTVMEGFARGSDPLDSDVPGYLSTQCAQLDYVIGRPGLPIGRLTTFYGAEGSGKSSCVYHLIAEIQKLGGIAIIADTERRFSRDRGERIGINLEELMFVKARTVEKVFASIEKGIETIRERDADVPILVIIDSLAGMPSEAQINEDMEKSLPARVARFVSFVAPRIFPRFSELNVTTVIVNQTRAHLEISNGPRSGQRRKVMGDKQAMIAENSLLFWSSVMIHFVSTGILGDDRENPEGIETRASIRKNSVGPEGKRCEFSIYSLDGIDILGSKLDLLVQLKTITQAGGWYTFEGLDRKFRRFEWAGVLASHPELEDIIKASPEFWVTGGPVKDEEEEETDDDDSSGA